jgi:hypothetical protein
VSSAQVLAHQVQPRVEQVERRAERLARRQHTRNCSPQGSAPARHKLHLSAAHLSVGGGGRAPLLVARSQVGYGKVSP